MPRLTWLASPFTLAPDLKPFDLQVNGYDGADFCPTTVCTGVVLVCDRTDETVLWAATLWELRRELSLAEAEVSSLRSLPLHDAN